jgi:hypothetical protein
VATFVTKYTSLCYILDWTEAQRMRQFKNKLHEDIQLDLARLEALPGGMGAPKNLTALMKTATDLDVARRKVKRNTKDKSSSSSSNGPSDKSKSGSNGSNNKSNNSSGSKKPDYNKSGGSGNKSNKSSTSSTKVKDLPGPPEGVPFKIENGRRVLTDEEKKRRKDNNLCPRCGEKTCAHRSDVNATASASGSSSDKKSGKAGPKA